MDNLTSVLADRGEISLFRCRPEYAYGTEGFKGVIPPSATLDFYIQLIGWEPELRWCVPCAALFEGHECGACPEVSRNTQRH